MSSEAEEEVDDAFHLVEGLHPDGLSALAALHLLLACSRPHPEIDLAGTLLDEHGQVRLTAKGWSAPS